MVSLSTDCDMTIVNHHFSEEFIMVELYVMYGQVLKEMNYIF